MHCTCYVMQTESPVAQVARICLMHMQDHDVYKKRLRADGTPIDEGIKHEIGPENIDESTVMKTENGTVCGSCYGAQTANQPCCNTCDEVRRHIQVRQCRSTNLCARAAHECMLANKLGHACDRGLWHYSDSTFVTHCLCNKNADALSKHITFGHCTM